MENVWTDSWPEELPASSFLLRWRDLRDCLDEAPPPDPLRVDIELIRLLDESFDQCLRYAIDPAGGHDLSPLIEWRRQVWLSFERRLAERNLFHPARLPARIVRRIETLQEQANPGKMAFVGFEFAGDLEKCLLEELRKKFGSLFFALPAGDCRPQRFVFSDPEQEIMGIMENLLESVREHAPHEIAVVLGDLESYSQTASSQLRDILGEPVLGKQAAYNLCPDMSMSGHGLYNAAVLPVRCALSGEKRADLFNFLRSPYYGSFSRQNHHLSFWDRAWRENRIENGIDLLLSQARDIGGKISDNPITSDGRQSAADLLHLIPDIRRAIAPFMEIGVKAVSTWSKSLRHVWKALQFPVLANELDQIVWNNLVQIISELETIVGKTRLDAREFLELLSAAAARTRIQKGGFEDAGIQIINRLDARGLVFEKIFVPGMISGSFPQPVRSLPLLTSSERPRVVGGTVESQFAFARSLYMNLLAGAPRVILSRPAIAKNGEICNPSPFWAKEREKEIESVIPWKDGLPAMQRTRWVRQSISKGAVSGRSDGAGGLREPGLSEFQTKPIEAADSISVSQLQSAMICPAGYFFRYLLGLEKLAEFEPGIPPSERGKTIHTILALFVSRVFENIEQSGVDFENLAAILKKTIVDVIGPRMSDAVWQVEYERLTGKPGFPGLLFRWLDTEWDKLLAGWSWTAVERTFDGMEISGVKTRLKGRLDRIDSHPERGVICWDYKTGRLPRKVEVVDKNTQPQLAAYLLALSRGSVAGKAKTANKFGAGFIELTSPGNMKHQVVFDPGEEHGAFLEGWEKKVCEALNSIFAGDMSPLWLKEGRPCEEHCDFEGICGAVMCVQ
jgi:RecB family exonuclease